MQFIRANPSPQPDSKTQGCVLTIGNFDGVHLGHRSIIDQLSAIAEQNKLPSVLMLFEPQPQEFFAGDKAPARLTRLREKLALLKQTELDQVICYRFNQKLASIQPE